MQFFSLTVLFGASLASAELILPLCEIQSCGNRDGIACEAVRQSIRDAVSSQIDFIQDPHLTEPIPSISLPIYNIEDCNAGSVFACSAAIDDMDDAIDAVSTTMASLPAVTAAALHARAYHEHTVTVETIPDYCTLPWTTSLTTHTIFSPTITITRKSTITGYPSVPSSTQHFSSLVAGNRTTAQSKPSPSPAFTNNGTTLRTTLTNVCLFAVATALVALSSDRWWLT